jgi:hypothetical protein
MNPLVITQQLLAQVPEADRSAVAVAANRCTNMTGERYSDALRAEVARYLDNPDQWRRLDADGRRVLTGLGYIGGGAR